MRSHKIFIFLYSALSQLFIELIGRIAISELIAILRFPFINIRNLIKKYYAYKIFLYLFVLLLFSLIISDIYNNTNPADFIRGWALIVFSIISLTFLLVMLSSDRKNIILYLFFAALSLILFGDADLDASNSNYFKVRFVTFLNLLILASSYYLSKSRNAVCILFMLYSFLCFYFDARSNGLIWLISSMCLFIFRKKTTSYKFLFIYFIVGLSILYSLYIFYIDLLLAERIGGINSFSQISKLQNPYNPFELIYYGRIDFFIQIQAIIDQPLFGHGSWARDESGKYTSLYYLLSDKSILSDESWIGYIRIHSIILGFWVCGGIMSFVVISLIFINILKISLKVFFANPLSRFAPIVIFFTLEIIWNFLFSPIGLLRTHIPIMLAFLIIEYQRIKSII